jgi:putative oxidoreductase
VSPALVRFIGISELHGGFGLIVPAATRTAPGLTPLAGAGLTVLMLLAAVFHVSRRDLPTLPVPVVLGVLTAFVAWGRSSKARIEGR